MAAHKTAELLTFLAEHAATPPYIPERDGEPCPANVLTGLHDAELGRDHATVAHDLDPVDAAFAALAPGYPTGGAS